MCETNEIQSFQGDLKCKDVIESAFVKDLDEAVNICNLTCVIDKFNEWKKLLPRIKPFYAVKCNDDNLIIKTLADLGVGFDCASKNEIKQVLEMGVEAHRIIFANPCKPTSHLDFARDRNVTTITVDNEFEVYKMYRNYPQANLVIRFRCEAKHAQCPLGDKFGCDAENDATSLMLLAKSLGLNVIGISFHVGSGCSDYLAYDVAINSAHNLYKFGKLIGLEMRMLDIGGGFPGSDDESFTKIANIVNASIEKYFPDDEDIEIIAEPGRYFVAAACTLICKIHAKRETRNAAKVNTKMYYLNDGVYGAFNCILYDHQHVTAVHFLDDENLPTFKTSIWGPTCDALDKILDDVYLPDLSCGDFLGFPNMGAYTLPVASTFNGFPLAKTLYFQQSKN